MLTYKCSNHLEVIGCSNSDFIGFVDSLKSILGYIFLLVGGAISWKSIIQTIMASSTMEAKFITCHQATLQAS